MKIIKHSQSNYWISDITQFIGQLKQKNPNLESDQRAGRALLWDKMPIDLDERTRRENSRICQQAYVYSSKC